MPINRRRCFSDVMVSKKSQRRIEQLPPRMPRPGGLESAPRARHRDVVRLRHGAGYADRCPRDFPARRPRIHRWRAARRRSRLHTGQREALWAQLAAGHLAAPPLARAIRRRHRSRGHKAVMARTLLSCGCSAPGMAWARSARRAARESAGAGAVGPLTMAAPYQPKI